MRAAHLLIVDDEDGVRSLCAEALRDDGYSVSVAASGTEALEALARAPAEIVLSDIAMPGMSGIDLLRSIRERFPQTGVILMTGYATVETAVDALRLGAYDYIRKPFAIGELVNRVARLADRKEISAENQMLREQLRTGRGPGGMIGSSPAMIELYRLILKFGPQPQPVLIVGESGTGKELVARAIHEGSRQARQPFVAVDCAALNPALIESELFGHAAGAFTGASQRRTGLLAAAGRGTLFLDELGELPLEMQAKLLRTIQQKEIRPVGSNQAIPFEARIVAATNRDLAAAVHDRTFREDLLYRLNVLPVRVPPLRDRVDDIPALALSFLQSQPNIGIAKAAIDALQRNAWPGNVRELKNRIERAAALCTGALIEPRDVEGDAIQARAGRLEIAERNAIADALRSTQGHRLRAARLLGIGKTTLYKKLKDYELC